MISHPYIDEYMLDIKQHPENFNRERIDLVDYLESYVLNRDDIHFDNQRIEDCTRWIERHFFKLESFQKFIIAFVFLYDSKDRLVFRSFFITMSRGGGKNGLISALSSFFISDLNGIEAYDGVVVANSEKQAKTSFKDIYSMIKRDGMEFDRRTKTGVFELTKVLIRSISTQSEFDYATSKANTKDGGRHGFVIFDEIHEYESSELVNVFTEGLGKKADPRSFFIGTNGFVREGFYDAKMEQSHEIFKTGQNESKMFPFICKLDDTEEVSNPENWQKAQPMFHEPMSEYAEELFDTVKGEYYSLKVEPTRRQSFMTKRMNLPEVNLEQDVASKEEILATNQPIPYETIEGAECIGGVDFGSVRDFTSVGLLFRDGDKKIWLSYSWARKEYLEWANLKPPIKEWAQRGLLDIVDEPSINPQHVVDWFYEQSQNYTIKKIIMDQYKADILRPLLEEAGFEVEVLKKPSAIHPRLAPVVDSSFANHTFIWDDNPLMRWYAHNVLVKVDKEGNKKYLKKDEHRHKTDGFQAMLHALTRFDELDESSLDDQLDYLLGFM